MPTHKVLAVDVGGSHVKLLVSGGERERRRFASGPQLGPQEMVERAAALVGDWSYDVSRLAFPHLSGLVASSRSR